MMVLNYNRLRKMTYTMLGLSKMFTFKFTARLWDPPEAMAI